MNAKSARLPADVLQRLARRSNARGLLQLGAHLLLLLLAGLALAASSGLLLLPALLIYGALLTFLFAPLHETIHRTAFRSRWLNDWTAAPIGFLLLIPARWFRAFHYAHHRHTQDPERDPELIGQPPLTRGGYWYRVSGIPLWKENVRLLLQHAGGRVDEAYIDPAKHPGIVLEARIHVAAYAALLVLSLVTSNGAIWWYWILPALLTQPLLRLFLMAEHRGCDHGDDMLANSRTTYTTPWLNFLAWNMPYHAEHHYLASIPFHALPALHAYTGQRVSHRGDGYCNVNREIYARL
ncbi:MAG: fatty acid desaturase [Gammaproteobacteria bacterium]|nr:fatty acid desaturase [Gammaproteobacteria bacterium]